MKRILSLLVIATFTAGLALAGPADDAYSQAKDLKAKGDIQGAIKAARSGLSLDPTNFNLNLIMGDIYLAVSQFDSSLVYYKKAVEKKGKDPDALYGAGISAYRLKSYDEALPFFQTGEKTGKLKGYFLYGLGIVQMEKAAYSNADLNFRKAIDKDKKNPLFHWALGEVNYRAKVYSIAISEYTQTLMLDSTFINQARDIHYKMAQSYLNLRNLPKSIEEYKIDLKVDPADTTGWIDLARIYDISGSTPDAIFCYQKYLELTPANGNAWFDLGKLYLKLPDQDKAAAAFESALNYKAHEAQAYGYLAKIYADRKNYEKAIDAYNRYEAAFGPPDSVDYWLDKGKVEMKLGEKDAGYFDSALTAFNKAAAIDSASIDAYELGGLTLYYMKEYSRAIPYFQKRIALDTSSVSSYQNLAFCYLKLERYNEAASAFEKALNLKPDDVSIRLMLAKIYSFAQVYAKAVDQYEYILSHSSNDLTDSIRCQIYPDLGLSYLALRKCQEATPVLLKAERCRPDEVSVLKNIALSYQLCNKITEAHGYYARLMKIVPNDKDVKKGFLETQIQGK